MLGDSLRYVFIVLLLFISYVLDSQNLVKNPGFEEFIECPDNEGQFSGYVKDWTTYFSSPDYFNTCDYYPLTPVSNIPPKSGEGTVGVQFYQATSVNPYREYLHGELINPLKKDTSYYLEFYVHRTEYSISIDQHSVHFSNTPITETPSDGILNLEPQITNQDGVLSDFEWVKVSGCFTAEGGESFLVMGNFTTDESTDTIHPSPPFIPQKHYALIDDVGVCEISPLVPDDTLLLENDTLHLNHPVALQYQFEDSLLLESFFIPPDTGAFKIDVSLEECGYIGSFQVKVLPCETGIAQAPSVPDDTLICLDDAWEIFLEPKEQYSYFINGELYGQSTFLPITVDDFFIEIIYGNCIVVDSMSLRTVDCQNIELTEQDETIFIPNAFSPNDDGTNDLFKIFSEFPVFYLEIFIFDRWGNQVFYSNDPDFQWNGKFKDQLLNPGVYAYKTQIGFIGKDSRTYLIERTGTISLVQ